MNKILQLSTAAQNALPSGVRRMFELAKKYDAVFVPLAELMLDAAKKHGARHYSGDCIHPNAAGHGLIARQWLSCCKDIL